VLLFCTKQEGPKEEEEQVSRIRDRTLDESSLKYAAAIVQIEGKKGNVRSLDYTGNNKGKLYSKSSIDR